MLHSACIISAFAQGTAFTYQGRLDDGAIAANGVYDFRFRLYDSSGGAGVIAGPITNSPVAVSNGLFTVTLDFGAGVFVGSARWVEIGVRSNGAAGFTLLAPRTEITPAPYAIHAFSVGPLAAVTPGTPGGLMVMLAEFGTLQRVSAASAHTSRMNWTSRSVLISIELPGNRMSFYWLTPCPGLLTA
jgi:hypothetical protein